MQEVSCRATRILLDGLEQVGLDPERSSWPTPLAQLRDPRQRMSWAAFVAVLDQVAALAEGRITLLALGRALADAPATRLLLGMVRPFVGDGWGHLHALRWGGTALVPVVKVDLSVGPDGRAVLTGRLDESFPGSSHYFALTNGVSLALSERVLGQTLPYEAIATPHLGRLT
ncbi:MAG: hypothetical protein HUU06_05545, partial [Planctomycetaceae bacterium]|nr:hypothetical protein [Planctomycetaceae bacterium]